MHHTNSFSMLRESMQILCNFCSAITYARFESIMAIFSNITFIFCR